MKKFIKLILILLLPFGAIAQDSVLIISSSMFNNKGQFFISADNGWRFKQGNDTTWAKKDIDVSRWQKLAPVEISEKYADKNGRVEGWFRLKIKTDASLGDSFGLKSATWAATDLYVDGRLIVSNGHTGTNGTPYYEGSINGHLATPFTLISGSQHTIAIHFVDFLTTTPPFNLKSSYAQLTSVISLTTPVYNTNYFRIIRNQEAFQCIWVSVDIVLSLLFWLLWLQNPSEKNLRLIAIGSTVLTLSTLTSVLSEGVEVSYPHFVIYNWFVNVFAAAASLLDLLILIRVFKRKITLTFKIFMVFFMAFPLFESFLPSNIENQITNLMIILQTGVSLYYILSEWRNLKGPQWAIVVGLIMSLVVGGASTYILSYYNPSLLVSELFETGYALSFPISLLIYVSLRFKEIMAEVRENAAQVVQLSEEKRQDALNRQKLLEEEVTRQTTEIRSALENLKATQTQLIQSEKMASLAQLTSGIAHEIQNPLNFVNNFSEVNQEMIDEMEAELSSGNIIEALTIATEIKQNEHKINFHGKRADAIVKSMLEHSRGGSGVKEPTDINMLAEEFLRLAYHGLRAKDRNFNAELITHFDASLPKIKVIPQDIGRVLLNLFNNAFYAVMQKKKAAGPDYMPTVEVETFYLTSQHILSIKVKDNGTGFSEAIKEKIMQPFFTTKPTGEGTGLGLSLSYDMVVKGHGGKIEIYSDEGKGSEFVVKLPV